MRVHGDNGTLVNHAGGSIVTAGDSAYAFRVDGSFNSLVNDGSVQTSGFLSFGVLATGTDQSLSNNGLIETSGNSAHGILSQVDDGEVSNSGRIVTGGMNASGIVMTDSGTLTSSGEIVTTGDGASGIAALDATSVNHSGRIETFGLDADALSIGTSAEVVNSGILISHQGSAIAFLGVDHDLRLEAPSFLIGAISLPSELSAESIELVTGPSHSVHWTLEGGLAETEPLFSGPIPAIYLAETGAIVTYDPTVLAIPFGVASSIAGSVHQLVSRQLGALPGAGLEARFGLGGKGNAGQAEAWIAGFDGVLRRNASAIALPWSLGWRGIASGIGWQDDTITMGVLTGAAIADGSAGSSVTGSVETDAHAAFAAAYARLQRARLVYELTLAGGWTRYSQVRTINDNELSDGLSYADASFQGWWLSPELALQYPIETAEGWTVTPGIRVRTVMEWLGGYTETGSSADFTVARSWQGSAELRAEIAASRQFRIGKLRTGLLARVGVLYQHGYGDDTTELAFGGESIALPRPAIDPGIEGYAGLEASLDFSASGSAFLSVETRGGGDGGRSLAASAGLRLRF